MRQAHDLPGAVGSFVGREREIAEIHRLLSSHRLLTLTGVGGCGKTRLALTCAEQLAPASGGRVWFCDLSALVDPMLVPRALAATLRVREQPGTPLITTLITALAPHQTLLVIDNCDYVAATCARLVSALLHGCPKLRILATSRVALGVVGERLFPVPPLAFPAAQPSHAAPSSPAEVLGSEAVRLFIERAREACPYLSADPQALPAIGEICRRLEGIPLAIELVATCARSMSPQQIAMRLDDGLPLRAFRGDAAAERHRTMAAALDWSYRLLSAPERAVLRRLSVFAGGWSLAAAEAVCGDESVAPHDVADVLGTLVGKSLVVVGQQGTELRYRMLETVRQYARLHLVAAGEQASAADRHLEYFAQLIRRAAPHLIGANQVAWFERLELELDNLRVAMDRAIDVAVATPHPDAAIRALHLPADLERFWSPRGYSAEGLERLSRSLALPDSSAPAVAVARAHALNAAGVLAWFRGDYAQSLRLLEEARSIGETTQDRMTILVSLRNLGTLAVLRRDTAAGNALLQRCLELGREMAGAGQYSTAWIAAVLGSAAYLQGDEARAAACFEESAVLFRALGDANFLALSLRRLGQLALRRRTYERAGALLRESLVLNHQVGSPAGMAACIAGLAQVLLAQGRPADAGRLLGVARAVLTETADQLTALDRDTLHSALDHARARLGKGFDAAQAEGHKVGSRDALAYTIARLASPSEQTKSASLYARSATQADADVLTSREREVVGLVARGHSNREIAKALTVEVKTVEAHLTRVRAKLGTSSRVQVANWARDQGLSLRQP